MPLRIAIGLAVGALSIVAFYWMFGQGLDGSPSSDQVPRTVTPRGDLASFEQTTTQVFESAAPSVIYIFTERRGRSMFGRAARQTGTGSGFVWDQSGHLITNHHVIDGADRIFVRFDSGSATDARLVGSAPDFDLAVLKVDGNAASLSPIPVGQSEGLKIGQSVFAIGNPFGLSRTLTTGIVSALGRSLPASTGREISGMIQTDAAINPGNSGGPLLDSAGRLIGVNTAIISESGSSSGIGFAVPVDTVNKIVPQIINSGSSTRPGIGITLASEELAASLNISGIIVYAVVPGSPAQRAGLRGVDERRQLLGDIIVAVNGSRVRTVSELSEAFEKIGVGRSADLTLLRDGRGVEVSVDLVDISQRG